MHAILQLASGGIDTLLVRQTDMPQPALNEILVEVKAAGVNRADILQREGNYPPPAGVSGILGLEVAGLVVAVGKQVTDFAIGEEVFGLVAGGGYAQYVCLDHYLALHKPPDLSFIQAASLPEAWMTAWLNLVDIAQVKAGQLVCIHAGASGVGLAFIQLAKYLGAQVMTTVGSAEKAVFCKMLGADIVVNYQQTPDFAAIGIAHGGVDTVLDCIGGKYLQQNISMLKHDGKLVNIAFMGGCMATLNFAQVLAKRITIQGSTLRNRSIEVKARLAKALRENIMPFYDNKTLKVTVDRIFPWQQVKQAHAYMEANKNMGKIVLDFTG